MERLRNRKTVQTITENRKTEKKIHSKPKTASKIREDVQAVKVVEAHIFRRETGKRQDFSTAPYFIVHVHTPFVLKEQ